MLVRCPQCGREVQARKSACPYCFAQLEKGQAPDHSAAPGSAPQRPTPAPPPARGWSWQLIAAAFISLIGVAIIVLLFWAWVIASIFLFSAELCARINEWLIEEEMRQAQAIRQPIAVIIQDDTLPPPPPPILEPPRRY